MVEETSDVQRAESQAEVAILKTFDAPAPLKMLLHMTDVESRQKDGLRPQVARDAGTHLRARELRTERFPRRREDGYPRKEEAAFHRVRENAQGGSDTLFANALWLSPFVAQGLVLPFPEEVYKHMVRQMPRRIGEEFAQEYERIRRKPDDGGALSPNGVEDMLKHVYPAFLNVRADLRRLAVLSFAASRGLTYGRTRWMPYPSALIEASRYKENKKKATQQNREVDLVGPVGEKSAKWLGSPWCCKKGYRLIHADAPDRTGKPFGFIAARNPRNQGAIPIPLAIQDGELGYSTHVPNRHLTAMGMLGERWMEAWFEARLDAEGGKALDNAALLLDAPELAFPSLFLGPRGDLEFAECHFIWRERTPPDDALAKDTMRRTAAIVLREISGETRGLQSQRHVLGIPPLTAHWKWDLNEEPSASEYLAATYGDGELSLPLDEDKLRDLDTWLQDVRGNHPEPCNPPNPGIPVLFGVFAAGARPVKDKETPHPARPRFDQDIVSGALHLCADRSLVIATRVHPGPSGVVQLWRVRLWWKRSNPEKEVTQ